MLVIYGQQQFLGALQLTCSSLFSVTCRCKETNNTTYRLVGVVEHLGTMTGGHYIAYVRAAKIGGRQQQSSGSKSWFYASDGQVREASLEEVLNCEAYILFYERVGD
jgi:ubiquitin carboxyl-terminal hydrolase 16/45